MVVYGLLSKLAKHKHTQGLLIFLPCEQHGLINDNDSLADPQRKKAHWLQWSPDFSSSTTIRYTWVAFCIKCQHCEDGSPWNSAHTSLSASRWIVIILLCNWLLFYGHHQLKFNLSKTLDRVQTLVKQMTFAALTVSRHLRLQ